MKNKYYQEIMSLAGVDELKDIVKRWDCIFQSNASDNHAETNILSKKKDSSDGELFCKIPGMLWLSYPGAGRTHLLGLISKYLHCLKKTSEYSDSGKFIEFLCEYCPGNGDFWEIRRLHETIRYAAGRKSDYRGIICIDISKWMKHEDEEYFAVLLQYLANECEHNLIIISLSINENTDTRDVERVISEHLRLERMMLKLPATKVLADYIRNYLSRHNITIEETALKILLQSVETLRESNSLHGYKTLNKLCSDVVYYTLTADNSQKSVTKKTVSMFAKDSEYIKSKIFKKEKNTIGFRGCDNER